MPLAATPDGYVFIQSEMNLSGSHAEWPDLLTSTCHPLDADVLSRKIHTRLRRWWRRWLGKRHIKKRGFLANLRTMSNKTARRRTNATPRPKPSSEAVKNRMAAQKQRDTGPEVQIRLRLHAQGYRYRVDYKCSAFRGRIDIAFPTRKVAVFIDGCFWHSCPSHGSRPKSNASWWKKKLRANETRDRQADASLQRAGWTVIRAWEHEDPRDVVTRIIKRVRP